MTKIAKKLLAGSLALAMLVSANACSKPAEKNDEPFTGEIDRSETLLIDCFTTNANTNGKQAGYTAKVLKDNFNVEINFICTNVSGESVYQTRSASGELGDIVILDKARAKDCIEAGILMDMTPYATEDSDIWDFKLGIDAAQEYFEVDGLYGLPVDCMSQAPTEPKFELCAPYNGTFMRLDYYTELGSPKINNMDEMLDVLLQMQENHPTTDSGKPIYGFSLFKDWDGAYMNLVAQMGWSYGFNDGTGFTFINHDASESQHVAQEDGFYREVLELYYKANQMGLVDPDSATQNWDSVWTKAIEGQNLFSWWSFLSSGYNSVQNKEEGRMMAYIPVGDEPILGKGSTFLGEGQVMCMGSTTEHPERIFEVIEWTAGEESPYYLPQASAGPQGYTWDINEEGQPYRTEDGINMTEETVIPDEFGGGKFSGSGSILGGIRSAFSICSETGESFIPSTWTTFLADNFSPADQLYKDTFGTDYSYQYLLENDKIEVLPFTTYTRPIEDTEVATNRGQCGEIVKEYSWRMIFAKDEAEFDSLWDEMVSKLNGFGYEEILELEAQYTAELKSAIEAIS